MRIPENLYQPIPFPEYANYESYASRPRKDCEMRYQLVKRFLLMHGLSLANLSMVDIGCANGYFSFRFLQEGGKEVVGVEKDQEMRELAVALGKEFKLAFQAVPMLKDLDQYRTFDVGLYYDLHYHEGINALPWIAPRVKVLFASCSGDGNAKNASMFEDLKNFYSDVKQVGISIANRAIFVCTGAKMILEKAPVAASAPTAQAAASEEQKPAKAKPAKKAKGKSENSNPSA